MENGRNLPLTTERAFQSGPHIHCNKSHIKPVVVRIEVYYAELPHFFIWNFVFEDPPHVDGFTIVIDQTKVAVGFNWI